MSLAAVVFGIAAAVLTVLGWRRYSSNKHGREREYQAIQLEAVGADEIPDAKNLILNVGSVTNAPKTKQSTLTAVVDLVLAQDSLAVLFRYVPEQASGMEGLAVLAGGIFGTALVKGEADQRDQANTRAAKAADTERAGEIGTTIRHRLARRTKSFVIPACDISQMREECVDKSGHHVLCIEAGFESYHFAVEEAAAKRMSAWLSQMPRKADSNSLKDDAFSAKALKEWSAKPSAPPPPHVMDVFSRLDTRRTLQLSFAKSLSLRSCTAIRQMPHRTQVAAQVRQWALERIIDSAMTIAGIGTIIYPLGGALFFAYGGRVPSDAMGLVVLAGGLGCVLGFFMMVDGLVSIWRADTEMRGLYPP